jgi:outer membrane protein with beta-barrel domain
MQHLLRRKIVYCIINILILPSAIFAQGLGDDFRHGQNLADFDDQVVHFGINLGVNTSHFHFEHDPSFLTQNPDSILDIESLNNVGINLAWLVNVSLNDNFAVRAYPLDLTFSQRTFQYSLLTPNIPEGELPITLKSVQSVSLSFPVQLEFNSDRINDFRVYTIAGGQVSLDLASNSGDKNNNGTIELNKFDYGVQCGIGFHLYYPFFVLSPELRVDWGLANLHSPDANDKYSGVIDKVSSRMISFSLTIE